MNNYIWFAIGIVTGGIIVGLIMHLQNAAAKARHAAEMEAVNKLIPDTFKALAADALHQNSQSFMQLAEQTLKTQMTQAQGDLEQRKQAVEALVKPIRETLDNMERERQNAYGGLKNAADSLQKETRDLILLLKEPQARGSWGETTLRRVVELAGMVEYCDFRQQVNTQGDEGRLRPDMIIYLPNKRQIAVDAKTPRTAYNRAAEAGNEAEQKEALKQHAKAIRDHAGILSSKTYWTALEGSPEFVVLFLPGEQLLSAALKEDPKLLEEALGKQVVLATPATLFSLLYAVKSGWHEEHLKKNAEEIGNLGKELYSRIATWTEHLQNMGKDLGRAVEDYNKSIGSLERHVLVTARRIKELGAGAEKDIAEIDPLNTSIRQPPQIEANDNRDTP